MTTKDMSGLWSNMTLLDYFAGQALVGIFANEIGLARLRESPKFSGELIAQVAYAQAEAMIAERAK